MILILYFYFLRFLKIKVFEFEHVIRNMNRFELFCITQQLPEESECTYYDIYAS